MPGYTNLKAVGLNISPNSLSKPEGSLETASNVIIRRDNVIEPRRGFKVFGSSFPSSVDRAKQLLVYKNRILRHYATTLQYDSDGDGTFASFNGTYTETDTNLRIKSLEANSNLYFTSSEGIKKISATAASEFTTAASYITDAGGIKAVDLTSKLSTTYGSTTGFLPQDSTVAYRVAWGTKDANSNTILGAPSQRTEVYNEMIRLLLNDYAHLLDALDRVTTASTTAFIGNGTYVNTYKLPNTATASDLASKITLVAAAIDEDIFYGEDSGSSPLNLDTSSAAIITTGVCTLTFTAGTPSSYVSAGDKIYLAGFSPVSGTLNGLQTVATSGATTITFATSAIGNVTFSTPTVKSGTYRGITAIGTIDSPTPNSELVEIQDYMNSIIENLKLEPTTVISSGNQTSYIVPLTTTTSSDVILTITVPTGVTTNHFYQVYRSDIAQAQLTVVLDDLLPNDEMQLIYEAYYESGTTISFTDITPDAFRGANLYTNEASGEGILQSNDIPPFAKDINSFKGSTFFSNCRTRYRSALSILGVEDLLTEYNASRTPKLTISNTSISNTYSFVAGIQNISTVTCPTVANLNATNPASSLTFYSADDATKYYYWYDTTGALTDPAISGATGIKIPVSTLTTAAEVRDATVKFGAIYIDDFTIASSSTANFILTNVEYGYTTAMTQIDTGSSFTIVTTAGQGERASDNKVLLSSVVSPAIAVDETARSLVRIINKNANDIVYAYYVSGTNSVPGQIQIESRTLSTTPFYLQSNNAVVGANFNPDIGPILSITDVTEASPTEITIATHGMVSGDKVLITNTDASTAITFVDADVDVSANTITEVGHGLYTGQLVQLTTSGTLPAGLSLLTNYYVIYITVDTFKLATTYTLAAAGTAVDITAAAGTGNHVVTSTSPINGIFTITRTGANTFTIPVRVTTDGAGAGTGNATRLVDAIVGENNSQVNRVYYSKYQQPESVPQLNYYDVGARDKKILRVFPLRDSLFIFKEDGLFRISGESLPFSLALFDSSCILVAPDSVAVLDNNIYCFTQRGISTVSEAGVNTISRAIDTEILKLPTYSSFKTASWAVSYESDNSYLFWTLKRPTDTSANICYRYSILTSSWTTYDKENTCGVINQLDDKLYLGAGDTNYIEQERKEFLRQDYADRQYDASLVAGSYHDDVLHFGSITNFAVGDVLEQTQTISIYTYNMLLKKIDLDNGPTDNDYYSVLENVAGANIRTSITALAAKLDADVSVSNHTFLPAAVDIGTEVITIPAHGYYTGMRVRFSSTGALPTGLSVATDYYLIVLTSSTFQVASTLAFANVPTAINLTGTGTGIHKMLSLDYTFLTESKSGSISSIAAGTGTVVVTTVASHGLVTGRVISVSGTASLDGSYEVVVITHNTFSISATLSVDVGAVGTFVTLTDNFDDILICYNKIIERLNLNDALYYSNYDVIDYETKFEAVITDVNIPNKNITLSTALDFIVGPMVLYKSIATEVLYSPVTGGDPMTLKHIGEVTIMFQSRTFSDGTLSFSTDLLPAFIDVDFNVDGTGVFGGDSFGETFFGGGSNAAPIRTYLPRDCQRHRYLNIKFSHAVARESYSIFGITLFGDVTSQRAYR